MSEVSGSTERETDRIEAFSDGVFAIAITLLILDIKVPHQSSSSLLVMLLNLASLFRLYSQLCDDRHLLGSASLHL